MKPIHSQVVVCKAVSLENGEMTVCELASVSVDLAPASGIFSALSGGIGVVLLSPSFEARRVQAVNFSAAHAAFNADMALGCGHYALCRIFRALEDLYKEDDLPSVGYVTLMSAIKV